MQLAMKYPQNLQKIKLLKIIYVKEQKIFLKIHLVYGAWNTLTESPDQPQRGILVKTLNFIC